MSEAWVKCWTPSRAQPVTACTLHCCTIQGYGDDHTWRTRTVFPDLLEAAAVLLAA